MALMWLRDCGLVHIVNSVKVPQYPLKSYEDASPFKLFMVDVGLLGAMNDVDAGILLRENHILRRLKAR